MQTYIPGSDFEYSGNGGVYEGYRASKARVAGTVIVLHDWHGITSFTRTLVGRLADEGYNVFAPDLFGRGTRPENDEEAAANAARYLNDRALLRARLQDALSALRADESADAADIAVVGYSFGGAVALELARLDPAIRRAVIWWGALGAPGVEVTGIRAPLLLLQGARDPWASEDVLDTLERRLEATDVPGTIVRYPDGYHAFGHPLVGDHPTHGLKYDPALAEDAWERTKAFLGEWAGGRERLGRTDDRRSH